MSVHYSGLPLPLNREDYMALVSGEYNKHYNHAFLRFMKQHRSPEDVPESTQRKIHNQSKTIGEILARQSYLEYPNRP